MDIHPYSFTVLRGPENQKWWPRKKENLFQLGDLPGKEGGGFLSSAESEDALEIACDQGTNTSLALMAKQHSLQDSPPTWLWLGNYALSGEEASPHNASIQTLLTAPSLHGPTVILEPWASLGFWLSQRQLQTFVRAATGAVVPLWQHHRFDS